MAVERFEDEWLVRLLSRNPQIPPGFVDPARSSHYPFFAQALVAAGLIAPEEIARVRRSSTWTWIATRAPRASSASPRNGWCGVSVRPAATSA